jgi:AbrB family looped-hinge helix DNA binding protein
MEALAAKVSSRGQIVLPKEIREELHIKRGDTLLFLLEGDSVRLFPQPDSYAKYIRGLGKEMWAELGGGEAFLREERASWE